MSKNGHNGHKGNGHGHVTETPDVSHIRNLDVTHEMSDVNINAVLKFVLALSILTVVVLGLMLFLFNFLNAQSSKRDQRAPAGPMAMTEQERRPPEPRLQASKGFGVKLQNGQWVDLESDRVPSQPQAEYRVLLQQWQRMLHTGKYNESDTVAALPIEEAMKKVQEGDQLRSRAPAEGKKEWMDYAIDMPTASSSGRTTEKRRQ
jgi:hypothetical protein